MGNKDNYLESYKIDENNKMINIILKNNNKIYQVLLPLQFKNYDFSQVDDCVEILTQEFVDYDQMAKNINKISKYCYKNLDNYIDDQGNLINLDKISMYDDKDDNEDNKDELLRVFVKTLKKNNMEVCSNCGDYFLINKKKIYNYDKDKMKLNLSNIENLKDCKHLYGSRLINLLELEFYDDKDINNFTSLKACSDSEDDFDNLNDTETENKISALKKLCGILKNMNESNSPKKKNDIPKRVVEDDYNDSSSFLKTSDRIKNSTQKFKKTFVKSESDHNESEDEKEININSLREKIKRINSKKKQNYVDSDCSDHEDSDHEDSDHEEEIKKDPTQLQQLILYFLTNPDSLPKLIDSVSNTIDSLTDNLNPTKIFSRKKPLRIQKYFANVNLVLKYIEMLKIIELKYKQTLEFKCNCDEFELETEALYFNDHLNKIWDMVKLIICELSALKLDDFTCSVPQCGDVKFDSSDLFLRSNKDYKNILQKMGFATLADGTLNNDKIILDLTCSKTLLINTIKQHQRMMLNGFRKYMETNYHNFQDSFRLISSNTDNNKDIWNKLKDAVDAGTNFTNLKDYKNANDGGVLDALETATDNVSDFNLSIFLDQFTEILSKAHNFTNVALMKGAGNVEHYAMGISYYGSSDDATTFTADKLIGTIHALKLMCLNTEMEDLIKSVFKVILVKGAITNDLPDNTKTVDITSIRSLSSYNNCSEEYQGSSYDPLNYYNNTSVKITIISVDKGDGKVTKTDYDDALDLIWNSDGSKYYELLRITYQQKSDFKLELSDKANKDVIIERRKKLINFLKQLENDTNLSLSFFGEMASSYNTTTDEHVLNAPPDVFANIFKNNHHHHSHANSHSFDNDHHHPHHHRGMPENNSPFKNEPSPRAAPSPSPSPAPAPASANSQNSRTYNKDDILNDSDEYDDTTDDDSENDFKLRDSPKQNSRDQNSFRKTYTGSKKNYV